MRVISWNIQWGRGADGAVNFSRMLETLEEMGPFDVICLQEVASRFPGLAGGAEEDEIALLREAFPGFALIGAPGVDVANPAGGRSRFGNVILSRLPVGAVARHRLPCPPEAGVPSMPRTVIEAVVTLSSGTPVRVLTTHLEYYARAQRMAQVDYLRQLQADVLTRADMVPHPKSASGPFAQPIEPLAALICGDFNFEPGSAEWLNMVSDTDGAELWRDAWTIVQPGHPHPASVGLMGADWPDHPYCCDFFFVSTPLAGAVRTIEYDARSAASDHQPVVLEIDEAALAPPV